jgi:hypothetical protein
MEKTGAELDGETMIEERNKPAKNKREPLSAPVSRVRQFLYVESAACERGDSQDTGADEGKRSRLRNRKWSGLGRC